MLKKLNKNDDYDKYKKLKINKNYHLVFIKYLIIKIYYSFIFSYFKFLILIYFLYFYFRITL
jgi:hypothetical protein